MQFYLNKQACNGLGSIMVSKDGHCPGCQGEVIGSFGSICKQCNETGYAYPISNPQIPASVCVKLNCKFCDGRGTLTFGDQCGACKGSGFCLALNQKIPCVFCDNKGRLTFGDKCRCCNGFGWAFLCNE